MSSTITGYEHIILDKDTIPIISGTTMKVIELVLEHIAYGWSPEELHFQHPYLTMGQVHSALAYYWDHWRELDSDIERRLRDVEEYEISVTPPPLISRLRKEGMI